MDKANLRKTLLSKNENYITILNIIGTFIYQGINFLITPYLTRMLDQVGFGQVTIYNSWVNIMVPVISLSVVTVIPHVKMYLEDKKEQDHYLSSLIGLNLFLFIITFAITFATLPFLTKALDFQPIVIMLMLLQCMGMAIVNFAIAYCVQYQKTIYQISITIGISVITALSTIILTSLVINPEVGYLGRMIGFAIPNFIAGVVVFYYFRKLDNKLFDKKVWAYALPICIPITFHTLSTMIISQSGRIIIQNVYGFESAGVFGFVYIIASLISILWLSVNNAWVPIYFDLLKEEEYNLILIKATNYRNLFTSIFCGFILCSPEIAKLFGGSQYYHSIPLIPILSLGMYFIFLYSFAINYKTICARTFSIAVGTVITAVINILLNLLLIPKYALWGAAVAALISYIFLFVFHNIWNKKGILKYNFTSKFYLMGIVTAVGSVGLFYIIYDYALIRWIMASIIIILLLKDMWARKSIF